MGITLGCLPGKTGSSPVSVAKITWVLAGEKYAGLAAGVKTRTVQVRIMATLGLVTEVTDPRLRAGAFNLHIMPLMLW